MKYSLLILLFSTSCYSGSHYEEICLRDPDKKQALYVITDSVWKNPIINICWEDTAKAFPQYKEWIQSSVEGSWEAVSAVDFTGWEDCTDEFPGVRIHIGDGRDVAYTAGAGQYLYKKRNGVNFISASKYLFFEETIVKFTAVHEFGHVLGFAHEQNRDDTPEACLDNFPTQGGNGDFVTGEWDSRSVMNYCALPYFHGKLSCGDIEGVQEIYGLPPDKR